MLKGVIIRITGLLFFLSSITSVFAQNSYIKEKQINIKQSQQSLSNFVSIYNQAIREINEEITKLNQIEKSVNNFKDLKSIQKLINQYSVLKQKVQDLKQKLSDAYITFRMKTFKVLERAPISDELRDYFYKYMIDNQRILEEAFDLVADYAEKKQKAFLFLESLNKTKGYIVKDNKLYFFDKNNLEKFKAYEEETNETLNQAIKKLKEFTSQHKNLIKEINEQFQ